MTRSSTYFVQMNQHSTSEEAILKELEEAFPSYGLDGGISLGQALLHDDWENENSEKMNAAYAKDRTDDWRNVPDPTLEAYFRGFSVFTYLDAKGWKFYLPAVLRRILKDPNSECEFYTRISLLPGKNTPPGPEWNLEEGIEFLQLTEAQGRVIARVLQLMKIRDPDWFDKHPIESDQLEQWRARYSVG